MKLLQDRERRDQWKAIASLAALLFAVALFVAPRAAAQTQSAARPAESPQTRQLHQALSLAERGDPQGAMNVVRGLLDQNPKFVPAIKLSASVMSSV